MCIVIPKNRLNGRAKGNPIGEGVEILIASKQKAKNYNANYDLASYLVNSVIKFNVQEKGILTRKVGIWVLQAANCPSALIECGYMDSKTDLKKLKDVNYQQEMAINILTGIETYLVNKESGGSAAVVDTVPRKKVLINDNYKAVTIKGKENIVNSKKLSDTVLLKENKLSMDSAL